MCSGGRSHGCGPPSKAPKSTAFMCYVAFAIFALPTFAEGIRRQGEYGKNATSCPSDKHEGVTLASFRWKEIGVYFTITAFIIIAGFAKLGFHKLVWLSSKVPESCLLLLLGLAMSAFIYFVTGDKPEDNCTVYFVFPEFTSEAFFLILLPPIILDSAYSLHDRVFLENLGTILLFAVVGTLINVFAIGGTLYGVNYAGLIPNMDFTITDAFVFSSLISAVDPVAVLAIFQELGVNQNLYFLIFGESLLNDGVTVVLYNTMVAFRRMSVIKVGQYFLAILSFFIVTVGGMLIGLFFGLLTALVTKWTNSVRVVEPLAMLGLAYLAYLTAELFHFSGIICLIVCGLIQAHFGFYNISHKSYICVKYFTKMASATSDTIIFMFLGMVLVNENHIWNTAFVLWSLLFCFVYRFFAVFLLSAVANVYRAKAIGFEEQFIASYGGLRGAVAFSLATTLDEDMKERNTYIFTTLIVILFTIFLQGITIKPLVHLLKIQKKRNDKNTLVMEISGTSIDHMMAGIEEILGHHGDFYLRELIMHYNEKYLKKWFLHDDCDSKLTRLFEKIALSEHYAHLYGPVAMVEDNMKPLLEYPSDEKVGTPTIPPDLKQQERLIKATPPPRRRSALFFFPQKSAVLPTQVEPPSATESEDADSDNSILRKAFKGNKYNKLHYTYNRNLVDEEDQELSNHLSRRSMNAHRMSSLASASLYRKDSNLQEDMLPGEVPEQKRKSGNSDIFSNSMMLKERHRRRSIFQRQRSQAQGILKEDSQESHSSSLNSERIAMSEHRVDIEDLGQIHKDEEEIPLVDILPDKDDEE